MAWLSSGEKRVRVTKSFWSSDWRQRQRSLPCSRSQTTVPWLRLETMASLPSAVRSALSKPWLATRICWLGRGLCSQPVSIRQIAMR
ncbi:hypothetical protein D3C84_934150 [compost metagenome]